MPNGRSPEPLSRAALAVLRQYPPNRAETDELFGFMQTVRTDRVYDQLKRYCHGEQDGVSILIAGTRGMGKTTMTKLVVQRLIAYDDGLIPLPLVLHGPSLLCPDREPIGAQSAGEETAASDPVLAEEQEKVRLKGWVLRGLITALYRHLCTNLIEAWENAVLTEQPWQSKWIPAIAGRAPPTSERRLRRGRPLVELEQLRGHLDLRLDDAPTVAALRKMWRRAGFLRNGVLPHLYPCSPRAWPRDQGIREIVAVAACAVSYLTILGSPQETFASAFRTQTGDQPGGAPASPASSAEKKPEASGSKPHGEASDAAREQIRRVAPPALATIATTAIGATHQDATGIAAAIMAGAAVYLAGWVSANFSLRRDALAELRRDLFVRVDWSERRLERELPVLLRRVKDAGFAPIFIIDELDKLPKGEQSLHEFIDFSKHIVRDHAAFLFLTHRDYFERLVPRSRDIPGGQ